MYHASIKKHARIHHRARKNASRASRSMYPSLLRRGPIKKSTLAIQSPPVPDNMAIDKDAITNTNPTASSDPDALHEDQTVTLSDASTYAENDLDMAEYHPSSVYALTKKLSSSSTLSNQPDNSDVCTSAEYDADAESVITCVDLDEMAAALWAEGRGFWVHDFARVRQFEEEKRIADMTGGGETCFAAKHVEEEVEGAVSEDMQAWIGFRFSGERKEDRKMNLEEEVSKEGGVRKLSDL
ncbi:uncharacterized protein EAF02_007933 [Botrytis sinoallii]|uniref:uncharacterized protein n=1 Tax=Botrytis sinoallii TaxID=1463999 RepID=UPI001900FECE|nr:uncharacterized protein EAF02_007933 [Botrytis sinoallii]KAF7879763.1 hypothetical protein EAF02_007933 [Botrytis sinoallii]